MPIRVFGLIISISWMAINIVDNKHICKEDHVPSLYIMFAVGNELVKDIVFITPFSDDWLLHVFSVLFYTTNGNTLAS